MMGSGMTAKEVGDALFIEPSTVNWHLLRIYRKLELMADRGVTNIVQALNVARSRGLIPVMVAALVLWTATI